ncbi:MAG: GNAT family N-acetyltransferase [Saprospiraceae bacterium]|nr:GNAT family N-acetyltransferase [Saprospiraceae bacterium]
MIQLKICDCVDQIDMARWTDLMSQLCPDCPRMSEDHLQRILDHPTVRLILALEENIIVGAITLAWYPIPTGMRACIEDVIVDNGHRGQKIGEALVMLAISEAKKLDIKQIDLTSRPDRVAANSLYQSLGFKKRETNPYRIYI